MLVRWSQINNRHMELPAEEKTIPHHFVCLPYINLGDTSEVDLGFAKVWNFDVLKEKYIPDQALREHVSSILGNYRSSYPQISREDGLQSHQRLHGIGMINTDKSSELEFDKNDSQKINDARLILFISFLAAHNTVTRNVNSGHSMASSENYAPVFFSAVVGNKYMSEHSGFVVPTMHGGLQIEKNILIRPKHVPTPQFTFESDLFHALLKLRKRYKKIFRQLVSAVEVFYEGYYNSPEVSHNARILVQASAFEILLGKKINEGRQEFKEYIKKVADYPEDKKYHYKSERRWGSEREIGTKKVMWADRFFTLRNHIIHGKVPRKEEYYFGEWQLHFDIALYFFIFCLKRKIEEAFKKELFSDDVEWKTWTDELQLTPKTYIGFEYNRIGRRWCKKAHHKFQKRKI